MKRIIFVIVSFVLLFMVLSPVTALAAEVVDEVSSGGSTYHDIFTRIYEFCMENKSEVISGAGSAVVIIFSAILKSFSKKQNKELKGLIEAVGVDASGTAKNQQSLIDAFNVMAKGYNEMREAYERYEGVEDDRNRLVGACLVMSSAVLEMMNAVFVHNKHTPQGVKDFVLLQYVNCQKALSDDDMLRQVVESVKANLNGTVQQEKAVSENEKQD